MKKNVALNGSSNLFKNAIMKEIEYLISIGESYESIILSIESEVSEIVNGIVIEYMDNSGDYCKKEIDILYKIFNCISYKWIREKIHFD